MSKQMETRWYYHGPDNETHGPYPGHDMMLWVQSGYFKESLLIRTEHEERYHSLGEWTRITGKLPFTLPVMSMEHMMASMSINGNIAHPPNAIHNAPNMMMMIPPGLAPPFPPPIRFPGAYVGVPQNAMPTSQPPSEPIDASSLSHTPDSEQEAQQNNQNHTQHTLNGQGDHNPVPSALNNVLRHVSVMTAPQLRTVGTSTEVKTSRNAETQTLPIIVNAKVASRVLSELVGQKIIVT